MKDKWLWRVSFITLVIGLLTETYIKNDLILAACAIVMAVCVGTQTSRYAKRNKRKTEDELDK